METWKRVLEAVKRDDVEIVEAAHCQDWIDSAAEVEKTIEAWRAEGYPMPNEDFASLATAFYKGLGIAEAERVARQEPPTSPKPSDEP